MSSEPLATAPGLPWIRRAADWCRDHVGEPLLATVFPPRCVACGEFETYLCGSCRERLRPAGPDRCPRCGHPGVRGGPGWCAACAGQVVTFAGARSAFLHEGPARRLVTSFKYDGLRALGREMAALAADEFGALVEEVDPVAVTWVPAHPSITRVRGYNQAEVFAREAARPHALPLVALVRKRRRTGHQRGLDREGRLHNLRGAFAAVEGAVPPMDAAAAGRAAAQVSAAWAAASGAAAPASREGPAPREGPGGKGTSTRQVILVDDVFTTGATVAEVSRVVAARWGVKVHVFTFSRTPADFPQRSD